MPDDAVITTQDFCSTALAEVEELPCFGLRGILPHKLTIIDDQYLPPDLPHLRFTNVSEDQLWESGTYYGDASGGEFSSVPRIRRVGCAVAHIIPQGACFWG